MKYASLTESHLDTKWRLAEFVFEGITVIGPDEYSESITEFVHDEIQVARLSGGTVEISGNDYTEYVEKGEMTHAGLTLPSSNPVGWRGKVSDDGYHHSQPDENTAITWAADTWTVGPDISGTGRASVLRNLKQRRVVAVARRVGGLHELLDSSHFPQAVRTEQGCLYYAEGDRFARLIATRGGSYFQALSEFVLGVAGGSLYSRYKSFIELIDDLGDIVVFEGEEVDSGDAGLFAFNGASPGTAGQGEEVGTANFHEISVNKPSHAEWSDVMFNCQRGRSYIVGLNMCCSAQITEQAFRKHCTCVVHADCQLPDSDGILEVVLQGAQ